jgi:hypothetical protein
MIMVGTAQERLCPPYKPADFARTGKSANPVNPRVQKYSDFQKTQISL